MNSNDDMLSKRLSELSERAFSRGVWTFSEFLDLAGQSALTQAALKTPLLLCGGYDGAERVVAMFGSEALCGYEAEPPIVCVRIAPVSAKFADELTHRDFLGSLCGLGIRREVLGDILTSDGCAYVFCLDSISEFIISELKQVKHTTVSCSVVAAPPEGAAPRAEERAVTTASERADAVISAVWPLSRAESQSLFQQKKVFINSRVCQSAPRGLIPGDIVSVRGYGRFLYNGVTGETKRARLRASISVYIS